MLTRLNQVMHGLANYFRHAVAKNIFGMLELRLAAGHPYADDTAPLEVERRPPAPHHPRRKVDADIRGPDQAAANSSNPGNPVPLPRQHDPQPLAHCTSPDGRNRGEPVAWKHARRVRREARALPRVQAN